MHSIDRMVFAALYNVSPKVLDAKRFFAWSHRARSGRGRWHTNGVAALDQPPNRSTPPSASERAGDALSDVVLDFCELCDLSLEPFRP